MKTLDWSELVFLDESGVHPELARDYGRGPQGKRIPEAKRHRPKASEKYTWIAAMSMTGLLAPCELEGSMTGQAFVAYVEQILLPELKPGQVLVLDNLGCHKVSGVAEAFEVSGVKVMYLPPYSPDFSPIEEFWSKVKACLKGIAIRSAKALKEGVLKAMDTVTGQDIQGWFGHLKQTMHYYLETL